jgi:hypothetical protein
MEAAGFSDIKATNGNKLSPPFSTCYFSGVDILVLSSMQMV